ncbi:sensor domain-containing diguanylate cyclase [Ramlibacter sp. PS4R-6]|uniref:sensor domain-containing diguanylate cyclase n=1 Tax=Ramlibacter sp. PS4R-6 TaxID=3133438 RepID=UPI0030A780FA
MGRSLRPALAHLLACALALLLPVAAQARHILDLDVRTQPAQLKDWGDWLVDESGAASLRVVLAQGDRFAPTLVDKPYPVRPGDVLWIRFTVPAAPDEQRWYVRIADPALDSVTLYTRRNDESWTPQWAGDAFPVSAWALPHVHPVLPLVVSAADPTNYLLRVEAADGFHVPIEFVSESWLSWEQQRLSLLYGVYFGLLAMGAIFSLATSAVQRDASHFWFGTWTALALLATASAAGVAGLHLWPESPAWSDAAHHVLPAAATAPFVLFLVQVLAVRERAERIFWPCILLAVAALGVAALCGIAPSPARRWLSAGTVAVTAGATLAVIGWAKDHGEQLAPRLLLAMAPFAATLAAYAGRDLFGPAFAQRALVFLLAGLAVSICGTYLLLATRTQARRDPHRRLAQLQEVDPLTGLVNDSVFASRMGELIERARRFGHQSVVAIVEFSNFPQLRSEFGRKHSLEMLLRQAERLNAMMRTVDTVARLGEARFGLLVEGPVAPSRAKALSAKVIAHCITPMAGLPLGMVLKPRVALALVPLHGSRVGSVMETLEALLRGAERDPGRIILVPDVPGEAYVPSEPDMPQPQLTMPSTAAGDTEFQPTSARDEVD